MLNQWGSWWSEVIGKEYFLSPQIFLKCKWSKKPHKICEKSHKKHKNQLQKNHTNITKITSCKIPKDHMRITKNFAYFLTSDRPSEKLC